MMENEKYIIHKIYTDGYERIAVIKEIDSEADRIFIAGSLEMSGLKD